MTANQPPWPSEWLMTDERLGGRLWQAVDALSAGGGIVFRHYSLAAEARLALGKKIADQARLRGLVLAVAGSRQMADALGAALVHNPGDSGALPFSMAVHNEAEARAARLAGSSLVFVSPVHATRSHPEAPALGPAEALRLARIAGCPAIALGGMDAERFRALRGFHGFAGIDCWLRT